MAMAQDVRLWAEFAAANESVSVASYKLRLDDLTNPTLPTEPYSASKGDESSSASGMLK